MPEKEKKVLYPSAKDVEDRKMNRIESVRFLCEVQIKQLVERQIRLKQEIEDSKLQIRYLQFLIEDVESINVLNYLALDKTFIDHIPEKPK